MISKPRDFLWSMKWPIAIAALAAGLFAVIPVLTPSSPKFATPAEQDEAAATREAMRMLHDEHDRILDQVDRQRARSEQKAAEDAHAFEQARQQAELDRIAAIREQERKLAEQQQRAAETKRTADASPLPRERKPKAEPEAAGAPLDIVPAGNPGEAPAAQPRGPIETVVAKVGDVTNGIKNTALATVNGITGWFASTGDKLFGRDKPAAPQPGPTSRLSSSEN